MDILQPLAGIGAIVLATCGFLYWYGRRMQRNPEKNVLVQDQVAKAETAALAKIQPMVDAAYRRAYADAAREAARQQQPPPLPQWVTDDTPTEPIPLPVQEVPTVEPTDLDNL